MKEFTYTSLTDGLKTMATHNTLVSTTQVGTLDANDNVVNSLEDRLQAIESQIGTGGSTGPDDESNYYTKTQSDNRYIPKDKVVTLPVTDNEWNNYGSEYVASVPVLREKLLEYKFQSTKPTQPTLTVKPQVDGSNLLEWTPSYEVDGGIITSEEVNRYVIGKAVGEDSYQEIDTVYQQEGLNYLDSDVTQDRTKTTKYYYQVRAVSKTPTRTTLSLAQEVTVNAINPDNIVIDAPNILVTYNAQSNRVDISWPHVDQLENVDHYSIYKNNTYLADVTANQYYDRNIENGSTYSYYVVAYSNGGTEGKHSTTQFITIPSTSSDLTVQIKIDGERYKEGNFYLFDDRNYNKTVYVDITGNNTNTITKVELTLNRSTKQSTQSTAITNGVRYSFTYNPMIPGYQVFTAVVTTSNSQFVCQKKYITTFPMIYKWVKDDGTVLSGTQLDQVFETGHVVNEVGDNILRNKEFGMITDGQQLTNRSGLRLYMFIPDNADFEKTSWKFVYTDARGMTNYPVAMETFGHPELWSHPETAYSEYERVMNNTLYMSWRLYVTASIYDDEIAGLAEDGSFWVTARRETD